MSVKARVPPFVYRVRDIGPQFQTLFSRSLQKTYTMVAKIGAPAPKFKGTAIVDGDMKTISLDDYKGARRRSLHL